MHNSNHHDLLIEIGTEELPPHALKLLGETFAHNIYQQFKKDNFDMQDYHWYASPRRLAIKIFSLSYTQPDVTLDIKGPSIQNAFDSEGLPTPAALGWAKSNGISVSEAQKISTDKGTWLFYQKKQIGKNIQDIIDSFITKAIKKLPISKPMRWGNNDFMFIRPVKTLCVLYGDKLLNATLFNIKSQHTILGHRFIGQQTIQIKHTDDYPQKLKNEGKVIADYKERREKIKSEIQQISKEQKINIPIDNELLDEVTALTEYPVVLQAHFDKRFLHIPKEPLVCTMKEDQRYFPTYNENDQLTNLFLFVTNIETDDPSTIITGNEKVIRPRFSDAEFFFNQDLQTPLANNYIKLDKVQFHKKLGTLKDKTDRIILLSQHLNAEFNIDNTLIQRAAKLSKCDLLTKMVFEFPETQGIMGKHYALLNNEDKTVAQALYEQYLPRYAGDALPQSLLSIVLALSDKIDTLTGIFMTGEIPKSDKDPFALRRACIGIIRIIVEHKLFIDLEAYIKAAYSIHQQQHAIDVDFNKLYNQIMPFILTRLKYWYQEKQFDMDIVELNLNKKPMDLYDNHKKILAHIQFKQDPQYHNLMAIVKRVNNILNKVKSTNDDITVREDYFESTIEDRLWQTQKKIRHSIKTKNNNNHLEKLQLLLPLITPTNDFFEHVIINAEKKELQHNRINLLYQLQSIINLYL